MARSRFDKVSFFYDFVEKFLLKDYQGSLEIFDEHLTIQPHDVLLEIGGGTGLISKALKTKTKNITVIDLSRKMLWKVQDPALTVLQANGTHLPFHEKSVDIAYFVNTLHHIPKPDQKLVLQETFRVLKEPGTIFIIEVWYPDTFTVRLFTKFEDFLVGKADHISPEQLTTILQDIGFQNVKTFYPKKHSWKYVAMAMK